MTNAADTLSTTAPQRRSIRSFVRREGMITRGQRAALERLGPNYLLALPIAEQAGYQRLQHHPRHILEIGTGMGDNLVAAAARTPDTFFIGTEVYRPGIGHTLMQIADQSLDNVLLFGEDIHTLLPETALHASMDEVWIFFPDPWPKKRHHKRRLISPAFITALAALLKPSGLLRLATDWSDYALWMQQVLHAQPFFQPLTEHSGIDVRFNGRVMTRFEQRGHDAGRPITDLCYRLNSRLCPPSC